MSAATVPGPIPRPPATSSSPPPWPERALLDANGHVVYVEGPARPLRTISLHGRLRDDLTGELPTLPGAGGWDVGAA